MDRVAPASLRLGRRRALGLVGELHDVLGASEVAQARLPSATSRRGEFQEDAQTVFRFVVRDGPGKFFDGAAERRVVDRSRDRKDRR